MQSSMNPAVAVLTSNLLMLDALDAAPNWKAFQAEADKEIRRIKGLWDEAAQDCAIDRLKQRSDALHASQAASDRRLAPIKAFAEAAERAVRAGETEITIPEEIGLEITAYSEDLGGVILDRAKQDPRPFIDAILGDVAHRELMARLGVKLETPAMTDRR